MAHQSRGVTRPTSGVALPASSRPDPFQSATPAWTARRGWSARGASSTCKRGLPAAGAVGRVQHSARWLAESRMHGRRLLRLPSRRVLHRATDNRGRSSRPTRASRCRRPARGQGRHRPSRAQRCHGRGRSARRRLHVQRGMGPTTTYHANDVVTDGGSSYVALGGSLGIDPQLPGAAWQLFVARGEIGPPGVRGENGFGAMVSSHRTTAGRAVRPGRRRAGDGRRWRRRLHVQRQGRHSRTGRQDVGVGVQPLPQLDSWRSGGCYQRPGSRTPGDAFEFDLRGSSHDRRGRPGLFPGGGGIRDRRHLLVVDTPATPTSPASSKQIGRQRVTAVNPMVADKRGDMQPGVASWSFSAVDNIQAPGASRTGLPPRLSHPAVPWRSCPAGWHRRRLFLICAAH